MSVSSHKVSGSDVNCRALVEDIVKNKGLTNYSKITKEEIILCMNRLVRALVEEPVSLWSTLDRIAPPRCDKDARLGRGYDGHYSDSPGGGPAAVTDSHRSEGTSTKENTDNTDAAATSADDKNDGLSTHDSTAVDSGEYRPKICRAVWRGGACKNLSACTSHHPARCEDPACLPTRQPNCENWHRKPRVPNAVRTQGNGNKGTRQPSNKVGGKPNRKFTGNGKEGTIQLLQLQLKVERQQRALEAARLRAQAKKTSYRDALLSATPSPHPLPLPNRTSRSPPTHSPGPSTDSGHVPLTDLAGIIAAAISQALASSGLGNRLSA